MRSTLLIFIGVLLAPAQGLSRLEVASVKRNRSHEVNTRIEISGGRLTITNASLKTLIRNSWDLLSFQFAGGPNWLDTDMFDIQGDHCEPGKNHNRTAQTAAPVSAGRPVRAEGSL